MWSTIRVLGNRPPWSWSKVGHPQGGTYLEVSLFNHELSNHMASSVQRAATKRWAFADRWTDPLHNKLNQGLVTLVHVVEATSYNWGSSSSCWLVSFLLFELGTKSPMISNNKQQSWLCQGSSWSTSLYSYFGKNTKVHQQAKRFSKGHSQNDSLESNGDRGI